MTNTARLLRCLRQRITAVLRQVEAGEVDTAALLHDANAMSDAYHLAIASVLRMAYAEAGGVVVGDEAFSARIYEVPHGVGYDGKL